LQVYYLILGIWFTDIDSNEQAESGENNQTSSDNSPTESSSPAILAVQQDNGDNDNDFMVSPQTNVIDTGNMYKGWFPTLQRTLWILSKLYQCVNVCFVYSKQLFRKITLTLNFFHRPQFLMILLKMS
jgi:hypothetical protein